MAATVLNQNSTTH